MTGMRSTAVTASSPRLTLSSTSAAGRCTPASVEMTSPASSLLTSQNFAASLAASRRSLPGSGRLAAAAAMIASRSRAVNVPARWASRTMLWIRCAANRRTSRTTWSSSNAPSPRSGDRPSGVIERVTQQARLAAADRASHAEAFGASCRAEDAALGAGTPRSSNGTWNAGISTCRGLPSKACVPSSWVRTSLLMQGSATRSDARGVRAARARVAR